MDTLFSQDELHAPYVKPVNGYEVIYCDPPWSYNQRRITGKRGLHRFGGGARRYYDVMDDNDLLALPVKEIAAKDAVLFMWATWPRLPLALQLIEAWGFRYTTCAFDWFKVNPNGSFFFGVGYYSKCLKGDSKVYVLDENNQEVSVKTLAELYQVRVGLDYLCIFTPTGWQKIRNVIKHNDRQLVRIQTSLGDIYATKEHRLFYKTIYRPRKAVGANARRHLHKMACGEVRDIEHLWRVRKSDGINLLYSTLPIENPDYFGVLGGFALTDDTAWAIGLFCAEGNYGNQGKQVRYTLHVKEQSYVNRLAAWVSSLELYSPRYTKRKVEARTHKPKNSQSISVYFNSQKIADFFGIVITGKGAKGKRLNLNLLLQCSASFRKAFLAGMLDGDGFAEHGKYNRITIANQGLAEDLAFIARTVGMPAKVRATRSACQGRTFPAWTVSFIYSRCKQKLEVNGQQVLPVEIQDFSKAESEDVYDLTVDGGVFIVNDIVSHNSNSEPCLLATRGKVIKPATNDVSMALEDFEPSALKDLRREHSRKPDEVRRRIEQLYPHCSKIELFARRQTPGWDTWGNEIASTVQIAQEKA